MAYRSLILGILFSIGIFALKGGVGLSYYLSGTVSKRAKAGVCSLYALSYLLVFLISALILEKIDLIRHLDVIQGFVQSGMLVHFIMACMLVVWGVCLLRRTGKPARKSRGWLLLAVPCPVCMTVIFFSVGFLMTCFPDSGKTVTLLIYGAFILINLIGLALMGFWKKRRETSPESLLGGAMLLIAFYFLLSVTVMPQFADAEEIYRMALRPSDTATIQPRHLFFFLICIVATFSGGFGAMALKIRRIQ